MKPLYLILICVSCSWGQGTDKTQHLPALQLNTTTVFSPPIAYIAIDTLLIWYSAYEKECYADSEYYWGHQRIKNEICILDNNDKCARTGHWRNIVRHEQPTFQGFIEYLKKRRK